MAEESENERERGAMAAVTGAGSPIDGLLILSLWCAAGMDVDVWRLITVVISSFRHLRYLPSASVMLRGKVGRDEAKDKLRRSAAARG